MSAYCDDKKPIQEDTCPNCGSKEIIVDSYRGEQICSTCGLVMDEHIICSDSKRKAYTREEKDNREQTGSPVTVLNPDLSLSTVIDRRTKNITKEMKRAIKWDSRREWKTRNLLIAFSEIKRIGENLGLPKFIKEMAAVIYRKAFQKGLLKGRSIKGISAAAVYYASRKKKIPISRDELLKETSLDAKEFRRCYRTLIRELNLRVPTPNPSMFLPKFISALNLSRNVENRAGHFLELYKKNFPTGGKDPKGITAAAVYIASQAEKENRTQSEIARETGVTEVTLRSRFKEFRNLLKKINLEDRERSDGTPVEG